MRLTPYAFVIPAAIAATALTQPALALEKDYQLDATRVAEIAATLPATPTGPGRPATDREFWNALANEKFVKASIEQADKFRDLEVPEIPDDLFLEYSRNGNRRNYEQKAALRRNRLTPLVLAECAKNTGEYMPAINQLIKVICSEPTWVLPAHDRNLQNFNNERISIDLVSSNQAWDFAVADYLIGHKLDPEVRTLLHTELDRRVIKPFQEMIRGTRPKNSWLYNTNNWNPVCFAGCTGAALIRLQSPQERAELIAAAEYYQQFFLRGFSDDGYCSEGVAYWNYGYGFFALMAENFRSQTNSTVDLFAMPGAAEPAAYGPRIYIINNVIPAFSDCTLTSRPTPWMLEMFNDVYGWNHPDYNSDNSASTPHNSLYSALLVNQWRNSDRPSIPGADITQAAGVRTLFEDAGIFIFRPEDPTSTPFAVAFKGGNNAEHHNHNDIGAYTLVAGNQPVILDPGRENYTRRTFSGKRYESKLLNSYGHPVPVIGGKLQSQGKTAIGKILHTDYSDTTDTVTIDMTSAYIVPTLKSITRQFTYDRTGSGTLIITDKVDFTEPTSFETALVSLEAFETDEHAGRIIARTKNQRVQATVASSAPYTFTPDTIRENAPVEPHRLGITLNEPVTSATITITIRPDEKPQP